MRVWTLVVVFLVATLTVCKGIHGQVDKQAPLVEKQGVLSPAHRSPDHTRDNTKADSHTPTHGGEAEAADPKTQTTTVTSPPVQPLKNSPPVKQAVPSPVPTATHSPKGAATARTAHSATASLAPAAPAVISAVVGTAATPPPRSQARASRVQPAAAAAASSAAAAASRKSVPDAEADAASVVAVGAPLRAAVGESDESAKDNARTHPHPIVDESRLPPEVRWENELWGKNSQNSTSTRVSDVVEGHDATERREDDISHANLTWSALWEDHDFGRAVHLFFLPYHSPTVRCAARIGVWMVIWTVVFFICRALLIGFRVESHAKMSFAQQLDFASRCVSNVHAIVAAQGGIRVLLEPELANDPLHAFTPLAEFYLCVSIAYFLYDLILVCIWSKELASPDMIAHHLVALISYTCVLFCYYCVIYVIIFGVTELTTPFVNNHWYFTASNQKDSCSNLYAINGMCMWLSWLIVRVPVLPFLLWVTFTNWAEFLVLPPVVLVVLVSQLTCISILNYFWFYRLTLGMLRGLGWMERAKRVEVGHWAQ